MAIKSGQLKEKTDYQAYTARISGFIVIKTNFLINLGFGLQRIT